MMYRRISTRHVHRHGIGGKPHAELGVEMVDGFHQTDAADLKQIVRRLAPVAEALHDAQNEPQIAADELVPRSPVARCGASQQCVRLRAGIDGQLGRIHSADLNLCLHEKDLLSRAGSKKSGSSISIFPLRQAEYTDGIFSCGRVFDRFFL